MSDSTIAKPSKEKKIFNQCITNDFKTMIKESLNAMDKVLDQRTLDLATWGTKEQSDFFQIFGSKGERIINITTSKRDVTQVVSITARELMLDCIRRLRWIKEKLAPESFINEIEGPKKFCAYVAAELEEDYIVHIGVNFTGRLNDNQKRVCMNVTGDDSRVSTLCHELSHFVKHYADPTVGGMGTYDYDVRGKKHSRTTIDTGTFAQHKAGADLLVRLHDENVFDNSYNIERYFQINN